MKTAAYDKCVITDVKVSINDGAVWLKIKATHETIDAVYDIHIPKVRVMDATKLVIEDHFDWSAYSTLKIPTDELPILGQYKITKIKDKTVKMTVEEIEKKLGHKIEIISK